MNSDLKSETLFATYFPSRVTNFGNPGIIFAAEANG